MSLGFFVTGTDTGVGKTLVSVALLQALKKQGYRTAALKPIASGCEYTPQGLRNEDALLLQQAMTLQCPYAWVNPVALELPVIPHLAAQHEGVELNLEDLWRQSQPLLNHPEKDCVIVEGAGGWHSVPLNDQESLVDYIKVLRLPVILVVGMRLGCVNHALLTVEAIQASQLTLAGWVANAMAEPMDLLQKNVETLQARISAPLLGQVPSFPSIPNDLSAYVNLESLSLSSPMALSNSC